MDHIKVWRFVEAPKHYQNLSDNGGDEDWIAFVPQHILDAEDGYIGWLQEGTSYGCCAVNEYVVDGGRIFIGCHS